MKTVCYRFSTITAIPTTNNTKNEIHIVLQVQSVFKAMDISVDVTNMAMHKQSEHYHRARTLAMKSDEWKNRPHRHR